MWLLLAGRGFGKTRVLSEDTHEDALVRNKRNIALISPTARDIRDVMIEGSSGILATAPPDGRPVYEPSLGHKLTWPNGAVAHGYSADEPDRLRGPQHDAAKCDEIATWKYLDSAWSNMMFGLRLGDNPDVVCATTPRPLQFLKDLILAEDTVTTRGSSFENKTNLSKRFFDRNIKPYENTRLGRQEIYAEILDQIEGALWTMSLIEPFRVPLARVPPMARVVVAVDPAVTNNPLSDETGIGAVGLGIDGHLYVLADRSGKYTTNEWVRQALVLGTEYQADRLVAEVNNGGDLVESAFRAAAPNVPFKAVRATRGKVRRAEPVVSIYERGMVHHVREANLTALETQMTTWVDDCGMKSPDRMDWLVWAIYDLVIAPEEQLLYSHSGTVSISRY